MQYERNKWFDGEAWKAGEVQAKHFACRIQEIEIPEKLLEGQTEIGFAEWYYLNELDHSSQLLLTVLFDDWVGEVPAK